MKKTLLFVLPLLLLFASCTKEINGPVTDESQWLNRERAVVVASDVNCPYYVVETYGGYSVLRSWDGNIPYQGSVMYGDFSSRGSKTFYNRSEGYMAHADVTEYWLEYYSALDEMDYQCSH